MQPILKQILEGVAPILATIVTVFLTLLLNTLKAHVTSKTALDMLNKLAHLAEVSVLELQQTIVDDMKAASADGIITAAEAENVKARAIAQVKIALSSQGVDAIMKALGYEHEHELDRLIETQVEAAVARQRTQFSTKLSVAETGETVTATATTGRSPVPHDVPNP